MKKRFVIGAVMVAFPAAATLSMSPMTASAEAAEVTSAITDSTFAECLDIQNNLNRLRCYDDLAGFAAEPEQGQTQTGGQGWSFVEDRDDFTNRETSSAILESNRAGQSVARGSHPVALIVRCDGDGGTDIIVRVSGYIGNDRVPVRYKFGDDDPISERWTPSTTGSAIFLPSGFQDFRAGLEAAHDFVFEVTDFRGTSYSAVFQGAANNREHFDYTYNGCR